MEKTFGSGQWIALIVFLVANACSVLGVAQQGDPFLNICAPCYAGFIGPSGCGGNTECEHGPENDLDDCRAAAVAYIALHPEQAENRSAVLLAICSETNGGNGNCSCYGCGLSDGGCDNYILNWVAWCGIAFEDGPEDPCEVHAATLPFQAPVRIEFESLILDGAPCCYDSGYTEFPFCGFSVPEQPTPGAKCSCLAGEQCAISFGIPHIYYSDTILLCGPAPPVE